MISHIQSRKKSEFDMYMKGSDWDVRIILNLDPLIIGINLDMSIKQWNLIDTHLLISSKSQITHLLYLERDGRGDADEVE
jgi:hypothetical protein